jgi:cyclase
MSAITLLASITTLILTGTLQEENKITATRISDRVLVVNGFYFEEHMTAVSTGAGLVIIDTLATPRTTAQGLEMIREFSDEPVKFLINTHFDDDHNAGNQHFKDAVIIGHANGIKHLETLFFRNPDNINDMQTFIAQNHEKLAETDPNSREAERLRKNITNYNALLRGFDDYQFTPPSFYIENGARIILGETTIELLYLGPGHTDADLIVFVPSERLLCAGDLVLGKDFIPVIHGPHGGSPANLIGILEKLRDKTDSVEYLVPGHGAVTDLTAVADQLDYLRKLEDSIRSCMKRGLTLEEAKAEIELPEFKDRLIYDLAHTTNIEAAWNEITREAVK